MSGNHTPNSIIEQLVEVHINNIRDFNERKNLGLVNSQIKDRGIAYREQLQIISKFDEKSFNKLLASIRKCIETIKELKTELTWSSMEPTSVVSRWHDKLINRAQILQPDLEDSEIAALIKSILYSDPWGFNNPKNEEESDLHVGWYQYVELEKHLVSIKLFQEQIENHENSIPLVKPHKDIVYEWYRNLRSSNTVTEAFDKLKEKLNSAGLNPEDYQVKDDPYAFNRSFNKWTRQKRNSS